MDFKLYDECYKVVNTKFEMVSIGIGVSKVPVRGSGAVRRKLLRTMPTPLRSTITCDLCWISKFQCVFLDVSLLINALPTSYGGCVIVYTFREVLSDNKLLREISRTLS